MSLHLGDRARQGDFMVTGNARVSDLAVAKVRRFPAISASPPRPGTRFAWRLRPGPPPSPSLSADRCGRAGLVRGRVCRSLSFATTPPRAPGPLLGRTATDAGTATTTSTQSQLDDLLKEIDEDLLFMFWG